MEVRMFVQAEKGTDACAHILIFQSLVTWNRMQHQPLLLQIPQ